MLQFHFNAVSFHLSRDAIMSSVPAVEDQQLHDEPVPVFESRRFTLIPLLFIVFFLLLNFQTITYLGLEVEDLESTKISDTQIRYYHWFSLVFALPLLWWLPSLRIPLPGLIYFLCAVGSTLFASYSAREFSYRTVTLFFAGYCFLLGVYFAHVFSRDWLETMVRRLFLVFQLAVLGKLLFYLATNGGSLPRNVLRPNILFYSAGGNNLEVTWLALSSVFFMTQFKFWPLTANCLLTSSLYLSRVGIIVTAAATAFKMIRVRPAVSFIILAIAIPIGLVVLGATSGWSSSEMVDRFINIGDKSEYGSQSRIEIWTATIDLLRQNPWGYGIGTGMEEVKDVLGQTVHQNNVHNIYLQYALDCGVQTLALFLLLMFDIGRKWYRGGASNPFGTFVLLYLLPGMIEFTGQEALVWMFIGIFYGTINAPLEKEEELEFADEFDGGEPTTEESDAPEATEEPVVTGSLRP